MSKSLTLLDTGPPTAANGAASEKKDSNMFTAKQMKQIRSAFGVFDLDDSGSISAQELGEAMSSLGQRPTDEELMVMLKEADANGNGEIEFEEFVKLIAHKLDMLTPEEQEKKRKLDTTAEIEEYVMTLSRRELKAALESKSRPTEGCKRELRHRLYSALNDEAQEKLAMEVMLRVQSQTDLEKEANGAVYSVGCNGGGQLGLSDRRDRRECTPIRSLRGRGVKAVYVGETTVFAVTESGDVFGWGGEGVGPLGTPIREMRISSRRAKHFFTSPVFVKSLQGEGICQVAVSGNHALAITTSGDLFVWGAGGSGQRGQGPKRLRYQDVPQMLQIRGGRERAVFVEVGPTHSICVTHRGRVYTWGSANKLGLGANKRSAVVHVEGPGLRSVDRAQTYPSPTLLGALQLVTVSKISCSSSCTVAITTSGIYSWGSGDGGRLGHGDTKDRLMPTEITAMADKFPVEVSCGTWHCAIIAKVHGYATGHALFVWGNGFHGQLGMGRETKQILVPKMMKELIDDKINPMQVSCGSHHMAIISDQGELFTWGNNEYGGLGRPTSGTVTFTPGKVGCFNTIIDGIARGRVCAVACGQRFTIIATNACEDDLLDTAVQLKVLEDAQNKPNQIPDEGEGGDVSKGDADAESGSAIVVAAAGAAPGEVEIDVDENMVNDAMVGRESKSEGVGEGKYDSSKIESKNDDEDLMDSILSETS